MNVDANQESNGRQSNEMVPTWLGDVYVGSRWRTRGKVNSPF
jgi:hypothetical protein